MKSCSAWRRDGFRGGLTSACQELRGGHREDRTIHFAAGHCNGRKLEEEERWDRRKYFFTLGTGAGCPERLHSFHPWGILRPDCLKS